jgi:signal transduction histidine kinase
LKRFYGIDIDARIDVSPQINGRIAAELLQMISEGLSNVLRHTSAKRAFVSVRGRDSNLLVQIGNEADHRLTGVEKFVPKSIHERAEALGGHALVDRRDDGYTVVSVTIPT